jgi:hypothetical protein
MINWITEKCVHIGHQKNFTNNHKACQMELFLMHLTHYAYEEEKILQRNFTGDKTQVNHTTLEINHNVETPIFSSSTKI